MNVTWRFDSKDGVIGRPFKTLVPALDWAEGPMLTRIVDGVPSKPIDVTEQLKLIGEKYDLDKVEPLANFCDTVSEALFRHANISGKKIAFFKGCDANEGFCHAEDAQDDEMFRVLNPLFEV
jgi:hypothetical protein